MGGPADVADRGACGMADRGAIKCGVCVQGVRVTAAERARDANPRGCRHAGLREALQRAADAPSDLRRAKPGETRPGKAARTRREGSTMRAGVGREGAAARTPRHGHTLDTLSPEMPTM